MPVLIIGGEGKPEKKSESFKPMRKSMGGIGGKYAMSEEDYTEEERPMSEGDASIQKTEAAKLLLRAIKSDDPELVASAISTLVKSCMSEDEGSSEEAEGDLGEQD